MDRLIYLIFVVVGFGIGCSLEEVINSSEISFLETKKITKLSPAEQAEVKAGVLRFKSDPTVDYQARKSKFAKAALDNFDHSLENLQKTYGRPLKIETKQIESDWYGGGIHNYIEYKYAGFSVQRWQAKKEGSGQAMDLIDNIHISDPTFKLLYDVQVGMTKLATLKAFGEPFPNISKEGQLYFEHGDACSGMIIFEIEDEQVVQVSVHREAC